METENKCIICLSQLFCSPTKKEFEDIQKWFSRNTEMPKENKDDILEQSHKKLARTNCNHTYHYECIMPYLLNLKEKKRPLSCPTCRGELEYLHCFARSGKKIETFLKDGIIDGVNYTITKKSQQEYSNNLEKPQRYYS